MCENHHDTRLMILSIDFLSFMKIETKLSRNIEKNSQYFNQYLFYLTTCVLSKTENMAISLTQTNTQTQSHTTKHTHINTHKQYFYRYDDQNNIRKTST